MFRSAFYAARFFAARFFGGAGQSRAGGGGGSRYVYRYRADDEEDIANRQYGPLPLTGVRQRLPLHGDEALALLLLSI